MKQNINKIQRMQQLAGIINESQLNESFTPQQVKTILANNGIDNEYLEDNDNEVEGGTEEWMDTVSEVVGKDAYDNSTWTEQDQAKIMEFIRVMEDMGIELI